MRAGDDRTSSSSARRSTLRRSPSATAAGPARAAPGRGPSSASGEDDAAEAIRARGALAAASSRSPHQAGRSRACRRSACSIRARLTYGSKHDDVDELARRACMRPPRRRARSSSCADRRVDRTICPGWTLAPCTASSARASNRSSTAGDPSGGANVDAVTLGRRHRPLPRLPGLADATRRAYRSDLRDFAGWYGDGRGRRRRRPGARRLRHRPRPRPAGGKLAPATIGRTPLGRARAAPLRARPRPRARTSRSRRARPPPARRAEGSRRSRR